MAYERRGKHRYLYAGVRLDSRVVKLYLGGGLKGALAAEVAAAALKEDRLRRQRERVERAEYQKLDAQLFEFCGIVSALEVAALVSAGRRSPQAAWEWRPHGKEKNQNAL